MSIVSIMLDMKLKKLEIDLDIIDKLNNNGIYTVNDLWKLKRNNLKRFKLTDIQIKHIIIKMQLKGIDLNKRVYDKN